MRTSLNSRGWRRIVAAVAVAAVPVGIVAATGGQAFAHAAPGSPVEVFVDTTGSASVADAIQAGWWGHEGGANNGTGTGPSVLDLDGSSPNLAATFPDLSKVRVAFVASSTDGSAEHPAVTPGESVGSAFTWFMDAGLQTGLNGNTNPNDSVSVVSTSSEFNAWVDAGQPVQGFDNSLVSHDVTAPGNPVSTAPKGKSILNRWASGAHISLVFYATTGAFDSHGQPIVAAGSDGHAITAYMPFTTAQKPGDAIRTSAGYNDAAFGAVAQDTHTTLTTVQTSPQPAGTPIDLTATVAPNAGTDVPVGSVEFFNGAASLGTATLSGGVAHLNGQTLAVGGHSLTAVYTPANTQTLAFNTSTSAPVSFTISGIATTTAAGATPGADVTAPVDLTATVTPAGVTGTVVWKDGAATIAGPTAVDGTGLATATHTFTTPGSHTVTAFFTPDASSPNYDPSQGSVTFTLAPPSGVSTDTQSITATIPTGTITVTTPYTPANPLDLGTLHLTPALDGYLGSATFNDIHVMDTRDGALPWGLTAIAGNLSDGHGHEINGENLGLTNLLPEAANNPGVGTITTHDNAVPTVPVSPADTGSAGLGGIAHSVLTANQGPSDAWYSGTLSLFAPTTTVSGLYTGTITFTAS